MLMHTREGTTIVTQQEKVKNETRQQFIAKALLWSILSVVFLLSRLCRPPDRFAAKKLAPLAKKLVKLDSAVVSMVSQALCHL